MRSKRQPQLIFTLILILLFLAGLQSHAETIQEKYEELGGPSSRLGNPIEEEETNSDNTGQRQKYEHGYIYSSEKTGAHVIFEGAIHKKWVELGAEKITPESLRYPTSDPKITSDGSGLYQYFEGGAIYWSPQTGARVNRDIPTTSPRMPVLYKYPFDSTNNYMLILDRSFGDLRWISADDKINSLYVPEGWEIKLWSRKGYRGNKLTVKGPRFIWKLQDIDEEGDWDQAVSSIEIVRWPKEVQKVHERNHLYGELVISWAGVIDNSEYSGLIQGPLGNLHILVYPADKKFGRDRSECPGYKLGANYPKALNHVILTGPKSGEWDDGHEEELGNWFIYRWKTQDEAVKVFVYESDEWASADPMFCRIVRRKDTVYESDINSGSKKQIYAGTSGEDSDHSQFYNFRAERIISPLPGVSVKLEDPALERARINGADRWLAERGLGELKSSMPKMFMELQTVKGIHTRRNNRLKNVKKPPTLTLTIEQPMFKGYRLDWCGKSNDQCGKEAANKWVKSKLFYFRKAVDFTRAEDLNATKSIESGNKEGSLCTSSICNSFDSITLSR